MCCRYQNWIDVCYTFHNFIGLSFKRWAQFVYRHPKAVISISLLISFALIGGFYKFNIYGQSERIFYPQDSQIFRNLNRAQRNFDYYRQYEEFILMKNDGGCISKTSSDKVLEYNVDILSSNSTNVLQLALKIHNGIMEIPGFDDFCAINEKGSCSVLSALEIFKYDSKSLKNIQSNLVSAYFNQSYFMSNSLPPRLNYPQFFGNFDLNISTQSLTTNVFRTIYPVKFGHTREQYEKNKKWENKMNEYLSSWRPNLAKHGLKLVYNTVRSMDDSVERNTTDNLLLITVSIGAMVLFCALAMHRLGSKVKGHFLLSLLGIGAVTLGIGSAFGLTLYTGLPYVGFVGVLPFLILGVGIDDIFIIVNKMDMLHTTHKGIDLIGAAMQKTGFSITMTTVTDLVAFIIGTVSNFPAVQIFCIYAFLSLVFAYALIVTLFLAILSYDIKRIESSRIDCFPCCRTEDDDTNCVISGDNINDGKMKKDFLINEKETSGFAEKVLAKYGSLLMTCVGKCTVLILSTFLLAFGIYGSLHTDLNFDYKILGSEKSDYVTWINTMESNFPIGQFQIDIVLDNPNTDYTSLDTQKQFQRVDELISKNNYFNETLTQNWMTSFLKWRRASNIKTNNFYSDLSTFLSIHKNFMRDLVFDANNKIIASRCHVFTILNSNWLFRRDALLLLDSDLLEVAPMYTTSFQLIYLSQLVTIVFSTWLNVLICCLVILLITLPFVINPIVSFLLLLTFISFILELLGVMYIWNLSLNSITMIVMVMAIGFTVDYSCHVTHAYLTAEGASPERRMVEAIRTMGSSVLKGGLSTLIGIVVLSVSSSQLFVLFFKMMSTIIVLGLIHGMVILPVLLIIFCRTRITSSIESDDIIKDTTNAMKPETEEFNENEAVPLRISNV